MFIQLQGHQFAAVNVPAQLGAYLALGEPLARRRVVAGQQDGGHVRVVAGVLHHGGLCGAVHQPRFGEGEAGAAAAGQGDVDRIGERAGQQARIRRLGRGGGARPRRPAASQMGAVRHVANIA